MSSGRTNRRKRMTPEQAMERIERLRLTGKPEPIRVGDMLKSPGSGLVWKVIETRPGGVISLFQKEQCRFIDYYHREIKAWKRCAKGGAVRAMNGRDASSVSPESINQN